MSAIELFKELGFNLCLADNDLLLYRYKTDYDDTSIFFYKGIKAYEIKNMTFVDNTGMTFVPMEERPENTKHSAYYGHWQIVESAVGGKLHNAIHQQLVELGWI